MCRVTHLVNPEHGCRLFRAGLIGRFLMLCVSALMAGCGGSGPEIGYVEGLVTLDGKPLPEAFVFFRHQDGGRVARAVTDESGKYVLNFSLAESGAIVGQNTVRISTFVEPLRDDAGRVIPDSGKAEVVPKKYNRDTDLVVAVEPGSNELNFELASR